jgi:hypothetical protein
MNQFDEIDQNKLTDAQKMILKQHQEYMREKNKKAILSKYQNCEIVDAEFTIINKNSLPEFPK